MDQNDKINEVASKVDKVAHGNRKVLDGIYKTMIKTIKKSCKTEEEWKEKSKQVLDSVCAMMGEENREFYTKYMEEMDAK